MSNSIAPFVPRLDMSSGAVGGVSPGPAMAGETAGAHAADVATFEAALRRDELRHGATPAVPATPATAEALATPATRAVPPADVADAGDRGLHLGDAILDTLGHISRSHRTAREHVQRVMSTPETDLSPRRLIEVQAALGEQSVTTQFVAGVSTQITRLIDQTVKMQ